MLYHCDQMIDQVEYQLSLRKIALNLVDKNQASKTHEIDDVDVGHQRLQRALAQASPSPRHPNYDEESSVSRSSRDESVNLPRTNANSKANTAQNSVDEILRPIDPADFNDVEEDKIRRILGQQQDVMDDYVTKLNTARNHGDT